MSGAARERDRTDQTSPNGLFLHTIYYPYAWALQCARGDVLDLAVESPTYDVRGIAFDADGTAWIATRTGVSAIKRRSMTLEQKADELMRAVVARHIRPPGLVERCHLTTPGDLNSWKPMDTDNDGMPDKWEYPWYAAWHVAFDTVPLNMVDHDFAQQQLDLMLSIVYLHPSGQIPAYEWNFSDVNPPVHAWATLFLHRTEQACGARWTSISSSQPSN
jgi:hypothetical protein